MPTITAFFIQKFALAQTQTQLCSLEAQEQLYLEESHLPYKHGLIRSPS